MKNNKFLGLFLPLMLLVGCAKESEESISESQQEFYLGDIPI